MFRSVMLVIVIGLAACGRGHELKKAIAQLERAIAEQKELIDEAMTSLGYAQGERRETMQQLSVAEAQRQYNEVAKTGAAGPTEALLQASALMANPARDAQLDQEIQRLERELETKQAKVTMRTATLDKERAKLAEMETRLMRFVKEKKALK